MKNNTPLTGKYAQLRDGLIKARKAGLERAAVSDDGGTCNFDSPAIKLPRWQVAKVKQAAAEAGCGCFVWFSGFYVFPLCCGGQANKVTAAAEAAEKALKNAGYDASVYYQAD